MNTGQRTVAGMLAVVAVLLGLNLIVRGYDSVVDSSRIQSRVVVLIFSVAGALVDLLLGPLVLLLGLVARRAYCRDPEGGGRISAWVMITLGAIVTAVSLSEIVWLASTMVELRQWA